MSAKIDRLTQGDQPSKLVRDKAPVRQDPGPAPGQRVSETDCAVCYACGTGHRRPAPRTCRNKQCRVSPPAFFPGPAAQADTAPSDSVSATVETVKPPKAAFPPGPLHAPKAAAILAKVDAKRGWEPLPKPKPKADATTPAGAGASEAGVIDLTEGVEMDEDAVPGKASPPQP